MSDRLAELANQYKIVEAEVAHLKERLPAAQGRIRELRPQLAAAIVDEIHSGRRTQTEISKLTGYTPERIRQLCRAAEGKI